MQPQYHYLFKTLSDHEERFGATTLQSHLSIAATTASTSADKSGATTPKNNENDNIS